MPLYMIKHTDDPAKSHLCADHRAKHLAWLKASRDRLAFAGPLLDGEGAIGSLLVVEAPDVATAATWARGDPLHREGLFAATEIRATRKAAI